MEKNKNPNIVVMDKDMYQKLLNAARIGAAEQNLDLRPIRKHVAKFNTAIAAHVAWSRQNNQLARQNTKEKVYDLVKRKQGQTLYHKQSETMYAPVTLLCRHPHSKYAVRVQRQGDNEGEKFVCFPTSLVEEVDPYWMLVREGPYKGSYVPPNTFR